MRHFSVPLNKSLYVMTLQEEEVVVINFNARWLCCRRMYMIFLSVHPSVCSAHSVDGVMVGIHFATPFWLRKLE